MAIRILNEARNSELLNAEALIDALLKSEPRLNDPDIHAAIIASANLPGRQLDLIFIYEDRRPEGLRFTNKGGAKIDSFVLIVEVKRHSSDQIKFQGNKLLVRYGSKWHDASDQSDAQKYAFKDLQKSAYYQHHKRYPTLIHNAIWLPEVGKQNYPATGGPRVFQ